MALAAFEDETAETSFMLPNGRTRSPFRYERCCDVYQISPGGATGTDSPPSFPRNRLCQKVNFEARKAKPSFPSPSVIPAKAGIQGWWWGATRRFPAPPRLDSRFRGNDDFGGMCLAWMAF